MNHYFPDRDHLVTPIVPVKLTHDIDFLRSKFVNNDFAEDYRRLNKLVREEGLNVPPLVHAYMSLSPTMKMFGTAINDEFGNVEESGIMILVSEITAEKIGRHVNTFNKDCSFKK